MKKNKTMARKPRKDRHIYDTNRTMARRPKRGSGWCSSCDRAIVGNGQKCPVCKVRSGTRGDKKGDNEEE
jgi:hypothetical protein